MKGWNRMKPKKESATFPRLLTVRDVALRLQISYEKALSVSKYEIGCVRVGRQYRIAEESFERYLKRLARMTH